MGKNKKKYYRIRGSAAEDHGLQSFQCRLMRQSLTRYKARNDRDRCPDSLRLSKKDDCIRKSLWVNNTLVDKSFRVDFNHMASVRKIKTEIEKIAGIPWQKQILMYDGKFVLDDDTQMIEDLKPPWRLSVLVSHSFQYISIKDKSDNTVFVMEVDLEADVSTILDRIQTNAYEKKMDIPMARILIFRGRLLKPDEKISSYHICKGDQVQLDRYNPCGYPRKVFIETGGKNKKGVRVGPFFCDPHTNIYDLKVRFINTTGAPKGRYRFFSAYNELMDHMTLAELNLIDSTTLRAEMPQDPLYNMKPKNYPRPLEDTSSSVEQQSEGVNKSTVHVLESAQADPTELNNVQDQDD